MTATEMSSIHLGKRDGGRGRQVRKEKGGEARRGDPVHHSKSNSSRCIKRRRFREEERGMEKRIMKTEKKQPGKGPKNL